MIPAIRRLAPLLPVALLGLAFVWNARSTPVETPTPTFLGRRAIVFGIDGLRADALKLAVESGLAPNIAGLIENGAVTWNAVSGGWTANPDDPTRQATYSGPGWSSVLTGVWTDKHGVTDNSFTGSDFATHPHFFKRLKEFEPSASTASLVSWPEINTRIVAGSGGAPVCACHTYSAGGYRERDIELTAKTEELLRGDGPDVLFHYVGNVDGAGHQHGFSPEVPEYMQAIGEADALVGRVLDAVRARPTHATEDWLFVLTSDHGGIGKGHGGQTPEERVIPFIASGGKVPKGVIDDEVIGQVAVPATVYRHLGLGIPADWGWESDAFRIGPKLTATAGTRSVALSWTLPPHGIPGLTGFEVKRGGTTVATLGSSAREWEDEVPVDAAGPAVSYTVVLLGSGEAPLRATASGHGPASGGS